MHFKGENKMTKYEIENSFIHYDTKVEMYRVKVTFPSGGICYQVLTEEQLIIYNLGDK
jgi:hypothetical protein